MSLLPLDRDEPTIAAWTVAIPGPGEVRVAARLTTTGAEARVDGREGQIWHLGANVRPPMRLETSAATDLPGLRPAGALGPVFAWGLRRAEISLAGDPGGVASVEAALVEIERHLSGLLIPAAAEAAGRFRERRWAIYQLVATDETGRMLQLARVCPGLMLVIADLAETGPFPVAAALARRVVAGERLPRLLDAAAALWPRGLPRAREDRLAHRTRIARATEAVPLAVLARVPGAYVVPEDIPSEPRANAAWYQWQAAAAAVRLPPPQQAGLFSFASRHAVQLDELSPAERDLHLVADYVRRTRRFPTRRTDPARLFDESARWHASRDSRRAAVPASTPLAPGALKGLDVWEDGDARFERITTVGGLARESAAMSHCVATRAEDGIDGTYQFFHGVIAGEPITVQVLVGRGGARAIEVRGPRNASLSENQKGAVARWLEHLNTAITRR